MTQIGVRTGLLLLHFVPSSIIKPFELGGPVRGYLRSRVFRSLVLIQVVVAIGAMAATYSLHCIYRDSLARHAELHAYRGQVEAISKQLQEPLPEGAAEQDGETRKTLMRAVQDAEAVATKWPFTVMPGEDDSCVNAPEEMLQSVAVSARELAIEANPVKANGYERQRLEQARERLFLATQQLGERTDMLEDTELARLEAAGRDGRWTEVLEAVALLLILASMAYVAWLQRAMRAQVATRLETEQKLRREHDTLERRINERTAELQAEVQERRRAEQLNRGRSQVLEMLARDEPTQKILEALVEIVANHRSTWACALHQLEGGALKLVAQSRLPHTLAERLEQITVKMADAPESAALAAKSVQVLADLNQEHRPWIELLRANGAQSAWSAPFLSGGEPLGTMTIYTRLVYPPVEADIEVLTMHCQMASLIVERQRMNAELVHRAYYDALTGIGNRRLGKKGLHEAIERSCCNGKGVGLLWIDLDKFKKINDTYGHSAGDLVLQKVAERLRARVRCGDTLARMGGDEFLVVMEGMENRKVTEQIADDLQRLLAEPICMGELQLTATASIGVSFYPEDGDSAETLQQHADVAMYKAKSKYLDAYAVTA